MPPPLPSRPLGIYLLGTEKPTITVELFNDLCCPFSRRMMTTLEGVFETVRSDPDLSKKVEFVFQNVPQPWHPQGSVMHECMFAVLLAVDHDHNQVYKYIKASYANFMEKFTDLKSKGLSRLDIHKICAEQCEQCLGSDVKEKMMKYLDFSHLTEEEPNMALGETTKLLKFAIKYHRIRGVHVTPTVFVNGIEAPDISSGWTAEQWIEKLKSI